MTGGELAEALEDLTTWVMEENADDVALRIYQAEAKVERLQTQLARVRAVIAEFQRIELTVSSNRDLLAALDGAK